MYSLILQINRRNASLKSTFIFKMERRNLTQPSSIVFINNKFIKKEVVGQDYKPPTSKDIPIDFRIQLLKDAPNPIGILRSKACGEPPLCMSCSVLFALKHAVEAARQEVGQETYFPLMVLLLLRSFSKHV